MRTPVIGWDTETREPIHADTISHTRGKRVRRRHKKMARHAAQRERVLNDRETLKPGTQRMLTEMERADRQREAEAKARG